MRDSAGQFPQRAGPLSLRGRPLWRWPGSHSDMSLATIGFTALGAASGFAFHRLVGCRSGACPIWANPYASAVYGALLGFMLGAGP